MKNEKVKIKVVALVICAVFLAAMCAVSLASIATNTQDKQSGIFEKKELNHAPGAVEYVPDEILVKFKPDVGEDAISRINSEYETSVKSTLLSGTKVLNVPSDKTVDETVEIYGALPEVEYAEPNYIDHAFMVPNDPAYPYQWHLDNDEYGGIHMESAWDISTGTGVVVAVIDTGVAYENYSPYCQALDLAGTCFVLGYDFVNNDVHPNDDAGHGTHVAGTVAQTTNNGYGVAGVAFDCCIMPIKTLNATGSGTHANFSDGVHYAVDNGADVISYSAGGSHSSTKEEAVEYAYNNGVTFVAAAGNEYQTGNEPQYPAAYDDYVIAVGATRYDETRSYYSNTGDYLDLTAPGGDITVDQNGDGYGDGVLQQTFSEGNPCDFGFWFYQGTSMATPHVSGVAALLIANGVTGPDNVRNQLESTAEDKGIPGWDIKYGWGIVDAEAALQDLCAIETAAYEAPLHKGTIDALILNPLRELRDDNLKDEYVDCYYDYSPELRMVMRSDPALTFKAARLLVKYSPMVRHQVHGIGVDKQITRRDVREIVSFTDRLKRSVWKNRDEIGTERSQEIIKFLDEFKEQVKASKGKTFCEALQDSIYYKDEQTGR